MHAQWLPKRRAYTKPPPTWPFFRAAVERVLDPVPSIIPTCELSHDRQVTQPWAHPEDVEEASDVARLQQSSCNPLPLEWRRARERLGNGGIRNLRVESRERQKL